MYAESYEMEVRVLRKLPTGISNYEELFSKTYIGKNPTKNKNSYHILRFNFSGIDTTNIEATIKGFKEKIAASIKFFTLKYGLDFYINTDEDAENILYNLFKAFNIQKANEKIYVIIDEYDHALHISSVIGKASTAEKFANELLEFHTDEFKDNDTKIKSLFSSCYKR